MTKYTIYNMADGYIQLVGETTLTGQKAIDVVSLNTQPEHGSFIGEQYDADIWYFETGLPVLRPEADFSPLSASIAEGDTRTLVGLPDGAVVTVSRPEGGDLSGTVDADGLVEIGFSAEGDYLITVTADYPFRTSEVSVNVGP